MTRATIPPKWLADARSARRPAMERLLALHYPMVHRMACALVGRSDAAQAVVQFVLSRSLPMMGRWMDEAAPHRWFSHHTLLTARRVADPPREPGKDLLVLASGTGDTGYIAFIRAMRALPTQQKEGFLLRHGEKLDARQAAIAMDCSMEAAVNHLQAAEKSLREIAGDSYDAFTAAMGKAYAGLTPPESLAAPAARRHVRRYLRPRRLRRCLWILIAMILAGVGMAAWMRYG